MSIDWFRDLIIVIFGIGATIAVIILVVLAFLFYFRLKPILDSIKSTTQTIERVTSSVEEEVAKPIAQIVSFVQGIRNAVGLVKQFTKREED
jgi:cell shape-determining protein MreC